VSRGAMRDILLFLGAATGPAMLVVLGLRLAGYLAGGVAIADLVALLVVGVLSPVLLGWLNRRP
jgi:predicted permease